MAAIQISDALDRSLQQAAERLGCAKDDLIQEALETAADSSNISLSEPEIQHLKEGAAQLSRGEKIPSEAVDQWFETLFAKLDARTR
jgi:predicted transcriptional regulator